MAKNLVIEIQLSQVRVAEMVQKGRKSRMVSGFTLPIPQGTVEDGYIRDTNGLGEMLKAELAKRKIRTKKTIFVMASSRVASREVRIPFVKESKIQSIINANATDYFPIDAAKYNFSYDILNIETNEEEKTKQYHLMIYAAPKSLSKAYRELAELTGLTAVRIDFVGNAVYYAVKEEFSKDIHILIKVEEKTTMITILRDGQLALQRNVNYGIDMAVEAVRAYPVFGTGLDFESALETLCNRRCIRASMEFLPDVYEKEDTDDFVREARREVTESLRYLVGNISRIMDYYISRNSGAEFASICLCGLGGEVLGLEELLTEEIGQKVLTLTKMEGCDLPKSDKNRELAAYLAAFGALKSKVSLQEKTTKKQKETKESLSGAVLIFCAGAIAAVALSVTSIGLRQIREQEQEHLYERIEEEKSVEEIYTAYNTAKAQYSSFQSMYQYTSNPNEGLVEFIEEMEEKMPSNITVETFSSTGTQVSFSMRLASKSEAANMLMQLRTFESLGTISTSGISEAQDGTVTMSVTCSYSNPAPIESGLE